MNYINLISHFLLIAKFLLIVGCIFVLFFFGSLKDDVFFSIGEPHLEITDWNVQDSLHPLLPPPQSPEPIVLRATGVDISLEGSIRLKALLILFVFITVSYAGMILEIFHRIVRDVKNRIPFTSINIRRVKLAGLLICLAPVVEWAMATSFTFWISSRFAFTHMKLVHDSSLGWAVFTIGLLIIVLGIAFEEGKRISEENELTI